MVRSAVFETPTRKLTAKALAAMAILYLFYSTVVLETIILEPLSVGDLASLYLPEAEIFPSQHMWKFRVIGGTQQATDSS
jgi:hypothetical protein